MKIYVFKRTTFETILAQTEDDARKQLTDWGYLEDEFALIDVRDQE